MKQAFLNSISRTRLAANVCICALLGAAFDVNAATITKTLCVRPAVNNLTDGTTVTPITFWGYTENCVMMGTTPSVGQIPGIPIEVGIGDTLNLTLNGMMAPQEGAPSTYLGHTIHMHGADVSSQNDGVPETSSAVTMGTYTYTWTPSADMGGSYMYHCHVHTVKHLEMGMYGPLIVRPKNAAGVFINQLTPDTKTAYDAIQTYLLSSVDPSYHADTAVGDSAVFADYNPKYFLINGKQGLSINAPAETLTSRINSKVALRLIGLHSVSGTFSIMQGNSAVPFTVYVQDGRQWPTPETMTSLDIAPGQRYDIIFTTPTTTGTLYPQFEFKKLRDGNLFATAYGKVIVN